MQSKRFPKDFLDEPREKGGDNDRNDGYFWLSVSSVDLELSVPSSTGEHVS